MQYIPVLCNTCKIKAVYKGRSISGNKTALPHTVHEFVNGGLWLWGWARLSYITGNLNVLVEFQSSMRKKDIDTNILELREGGPFILVMSCIDWKHCVMVTTLQRWRFSRNPHQAAFKVMNWIYCVLLSIWPCLVLLHKTKMHYLSP